MSARRTRKYRSLKKLLEKDSSSSSGENDCSDIGEICCDHATVQDNQPCSETSRESPERDGRTGLDSPVSPPSPLVVSSSSSSSDCARYDIYSSSEDDPMLDVSPVRQETEVQPNFTQKLREWAVRNIDHVTHSAITDLLQVLRDEGYRELPKTAETLLRTARRNTDYTIRPMMDKRREQMGEFSYFGIQNQLRKIISPEVFHDDEVQVLVNVDGMPVYRHSRVSMWPIVIQICNAEFEKKPIVVGIYCGCSKPKSPNEYLRDFVQECIDLKENGLKIQNKIYSFKIIAFGCDTPARSFLKCTKGHCGYYSCERCVTKGETRMPYNKRLFPEIDCMSRTYESFKEQAQLEHHLSGETSPLLDIPEFDPVMGCTLDYLHLLFAGLMKWLLDIIVNGDKDNKKIHDDLIEELNKLLKQCISPSVPKEFQRKTFDVTDLTNWKATQYRFFLLYAGGIVFKNILPDDKFRHFLHAYAACRILCDEDAAVSRVGEARDLLRTFFDEMPRYYGIHSQAMNMHNLIHIPDDVEHLKMPLPMFSTFPFENYLGHLKKLVRTPNAPLAQVIRRLSEMEATSDMICRPIPAVSRWKQIKNNKQLAPTDLIALKEIQIKSTLLSICHPDNIVQLKNGDILKIIGISLVDDEVIGAHLEPSDILLQGYLISKTGSVFDDPCSSVGLGVTRLGSKARQATTHNAQDVRRKCVMMELPDNHNYAVTLLHL